jgi:hypothetical protein
MLVFVPELDNKMGKLILLFNIQKATEGSYAIGGASKEESYGSSAQTETVIVRDISFSSKMHTGFSR